MSENRKSAPRPRADSREDAATRKLFGDLSTVPADNPGSRRAVARRELHVELHRHTARLRGTHVRQLLDAAGVTTRMYDRERGCWARPVDRAADVLAVAEYRQRRIVTVIEAER